MRKILITGGFGYIGGRIAQAIQSSDEFQAILGSRVRREKPHWLPQASVIDTPWRDIDGLRNACENVSSIIHLSAMNEIEAARDPVAALEVNGVATVRLLEAAKASGVKRFIYFSTAHVYGAPLVGELSERVCPKPVHPYATSHKAAEDAVLAENSADKIAGIVIRLSNSFGCPTHENIDRWTLLVNDLCMQAVTHRQLTLKTPGMQRRDFVTLTDVGNAVLHICRNNCIVGVYNLGGEWAPTIYDMSILIAERCHTLFGYKPNIVRPSGSADKQSLMYDMDKLKSTGFSLVKNHIEEIDNTLAFCNEIIRKHEVV